MKLKLRKVDTVHETYMGVIFKVLRNNLVHMPMSLTVAAISKGLEELCGLYDNVSYI